MSEPDNPDNDVWTFPLGSGMTLRDWFAGQAITGILGMNLSADQDLLDEDGRTTAALFAYLLADAMLNVRSK